MAKALADAEGEMLDEDRRPVIFCLIHELEIILTTATEDSFLAALRSAQEERFT